MSECERVTYTSQEHGDIVTGDCSAARALRDFERALRDAVGNPVRHDGGSAGVYERSPKGDKTEQWSYGNAVAYTGAVREVLALLDEHIARTERGQP